MTPTSRKESRGPRPKRIVSGGQTGVDRAALDVALALGIPHGGWCPKGRLAEDRVIPPQYQLTETDSPEYPVRTEKNVVDSDGTLIFCRGQTSGGTELTRQLALQHGKPCLVVDLNRPLSADDVSHWIFESQIETLNVAGPRESQNTGISAQARQFLEGLLGNA
jgi:putative molybdenum carrier protein